MTNYVLQLEPVVQRLPEGYYYRMGIKNIVENDGSAVLAGNVTGLVTTDNFQSDVARRVGETSRSSVVMTLPVLYSEFIVAQATALVTGPQQVGWSIVQPEAYGLTDGKKIYPTYQRFRPPGVDQYTTDSFWDLQSNIATIAVELPVTLHVDDPAYLVMTVAVILTVTAFRYKDGVIPSTLAISMTSADSTSDLSSLFSDMGDI